MSMVPESEADRSSARAKSTVLANGWLTADRAAGYLGLPSRRALYMAVRRGQVPVHRLGRRMRFFVPELDAALRGEEPLHRGR